MKIFNKMGIHKVTDIDYSIENKDTELNLDGTSVKYREGFLDYTIESDKVVYIVSYEKQRFKDERNKVTSVVEIKEFNMFTNEVGTMKVRQDKYHILIMLKEVYDKIKESIENGEEGVYAEINKKGIHSMMTEYKTAEFASSSGYLANCENVFHLDGSTI